jgi:hypothetical protein
MPRVAKTIQIKMRLFSFIVQLENGQKVAQATESKGYQCTLLWIIPSILTRMKCEIRVTEAHYTNHMYFNLVGLRVLSGAHLLFMRG